MLRDLTYWARLRAAMEGAINNIPSIAVSLMPHREDSDFSAAAEITNRIATRHQARCSPDTFLNVNFPNVTRRAARRSRHALGKRIYRDGCRAAGSVW
jgi:5'/3'-nucleotidase SurE